MFPGTRLADTEVSALLHTPVDTNVYSGVVAARMLRGITPLPAGERSFFEAGTLPLERIEVMQHCWLNTTEVSVPNSKGIIRSSDAFNVSFFLVGKVASSSGRHIMEKGFGGKHAHAELPHQFTQRHMIAVRDPILRMMAQYEEQFVRHPPWKPETLRVLPTELLGYHAGAGGSYSDYERLFCNATTEQKIVHSKRLRDNSVRMANGAPPIDRNPCNSIPTHEDGVLARIFDSFMDRWDLRTVFDVHLTLQLASLSQFDTNHPRLGGRPVRVDELFDIVSGDAAWRGLAARSGLPASQMEQTILSKGRSYPKRVNMSKVRNSSIRRICRYAALDLCCLNYPLPPQCSHFRGTNSGVLCEVARRPDVRTGGSSLSVAPFVFDPSRQSHLARRLHPHDGARHRAAQGGGRRAGRLSERPMQRRKTKATKGTKVIEVVEATEAT